MSDDLSGKNIKVPLVDSSGNPMRTSAPQMHTFELRVYEKASEGEENKYLFSTVYNLPILLDTIASKVEDDKTLLVIKVKIQNKDNEVDYFAGAKDEVLTKLRPKIINSNDAMVSLFTKVNELAHFSNLAGILATAGFSMGENLEIKGFGFLSPSYERNPRALRALVDSSDNHNNAFRDGLKKEYGIDITDKIILPS